MNPPRFRTQWFQAIRTRPRYVGRYIVQPEGSEKLVYRYWNGAAWQYNRRKKFVPAGFGTRDGDVWAGSPEKAGT